MSADGWADLLAAVATTLLWVGLIAFIVWRFEEPIKRDLLPRISGVGIMGWRLDLAERVTDEALQKPDYSPPPNAGDILLRRLKASGDLLREASILWLDDHPVNNVVERRFLARTGAWVETVRSTAEAKEALRWARYDTVVADLDRDAERPTPRIAEEAAALLRGTPVIYYISDLDPKLGTPAGALGITDKPDELYELVITAVERSRATSPA
jgi:hypothetical protein